jgi:hypothetical protein
VSHELSESSAETSEDSEDVDPEHQTSDSHEALRDASSLPDKTEEELRVLFAMLFRMYPIGSSTDASTTVAAAAEDEPGPCPDVWDDCPDIAANGWCSADNSDWWETNQKNCPLSCDTGFTDCDRFDTPPLPGSPAATALEFLPTAQAWVAAASRQLGLHQAGDLMTTYFGTNDEGARVTVKSVVDGLTNVLANPYFRTNVEECNENEALAYVLLGQKNAQGQYVINICEKAVNYGCNVCIVGTIVHEATHHLGTKDFAYTGETLALAKSDPAKAQNNAENIQEFIRAVNGGFN